MSYLADNALTYAGGTAMRVPVVTSEFKINYVRPALGVRLVARAEAVAVGAAQTVCRCDVFAVAGDGSGETGRSRARHHRPTRRREGASVIAVQRLWFVTRSQQLALPQRQVDTGRRRQNRQKST